MRERERSDLFFFYSVNSEGRQEQTAQIIMGFVSGSDPRKLFSTEKKRAEERLKDKIFLVFYSLNIDRKEEQTQKLSDVLSQDQISESST